MQKRRGNPNAAWYMPAKGQSGRKASPDLIEAKKIDPKLVNSLMTDMLAMDKDTLKMKLEHPLCSMLELIIGAVIMKAVNDGCLIRLNFLLSRITDMTDPSNTVPAQSFSPVIVSLPSNGREVFDIDAELGLKND